MAINLDHPLDWEAARDDARVMLEDLQGNILKGHGRHHTANLFLNFGALGDSEVRPVLRSIGRQLTSALDQLRDAKAFAESGLSAGRFLAFFLTALGYEKLGEAALASRPEDQAFIAGLLARRDELADPKSADLDEHFQQNGVRKQIHAMLLVAHDTKELTRAEARRWKALLGFGGIEVVGVEYGLQHFDVTGEGIENFGYVDGRSQPLMLQQDIIKEAKAANVTGDPLDHASWRWSPVFPLSQALVPDKGGAHKGASFGSYFVFRKLEQDVKGFKDRESEGNESLADALGLKADNIPAGERERAGAMVVGRYENGTPFVQEFVPDKGEEPDAGPVNNFDFDQDPDGALCPFRGHIRKTNPRGDIMREFGADFDAARRPIMARRGITYGDRVQDEAKDFVDRPTGGVGLLFMAYMQNIANQFEFTQASWANNAGFLRPGTGIDPVIGQGENGPGDISWPDGYGNPGKADFDFGLFVHLKGGEYFFAPSKSFLTSL